MIDRRQLLTVGGLFGALAPAGDSAAYGTGQMSERAAADVVAALRGISNAVAAQHSFDAIVPIISSTSAWTCGCLRTTGTCDFSRDWSWVATLRAATR